MRIEVLDRCGIRGQRRLRCRCGRGAEAVAARGRFVMAVSGGHTPWVMLRALAAADVPWPAFTSFRSTSGLLRLGTRTGISHICAKACSIMPHCPLGRSTLCRWRFADLEVAAAKYAGNSRQIAGIAAGAGSRSLGLGTRWTYCFPGSRRSRAEHRRCRRCDTGDLPGEQRMTLTYPIINRARTVFWLVTGAEKVPMLHAPARWRQVDPGGAGASGNNAIVLADKPQRASLRQTRSRTDRKEMTCGWNCDRSWWL